MKKLSLTLLTAIFATFVSLVQPALATNLQDQNQGKITCPWGFFVNQAYSKDKYHWIVYNQSDNFGTERDWTFYISDTLNTPDPNAAIKYANAVLGGLKLTSEGTVQDHEYECVYFSTGTASFMAVAITPSFNIEDVLQSSKKSLISVKDKV